jgi:MtrB/PioB family decaheme-associated outer membrane protein
MSASSSAIRICLALALFAARVSAQDVPPPDTSKWKCESCPFAKGHVATYDAGGSYVSDDAARFGNATGYDEEGGYVDLNGTGRYADEDYRMNWEVEDLGLDSRSLEVEGGKPGTYKYRLEYSELPYRRYDTTQTVFRQAQGDQLILPPNWVPAGTTGGFTALDASLADRDIESDRQTVGIGGEYLGSKHLRLQADFRRVEREGWGIAGGPFYTTSALLAAPFDDYTDTANLMATYDREKWSTSLSWTGSFYQDAKLQLLWDNPYSADGQGARAQAPDNKSQTVTLAGAYHFSPQTTLSMTAAVGEIRQEDALLSYTINPAIAARPLPRDSLDGKIETTHVDIGFTTRPWDFLRLKGVYRYDDRDNRTPVELWTRTITDLFDSGESESNRPYSYKRGKLELSAAARLDFWDWLKAFAFEGGYDLTEIDRTLQEVASSTEESGWGRVRWRPTSEMELTLRAGIARRDPDNYDLTVAQADEQNPLMRQFNQAYRYRQFSQLNARIGFPGKPITIGAEIFYASDDYTESSLGLRKFDDRRFAADFTWAINDATSVYLQGGYEDLASASNNSETAGVADWNSQHRDQFHTLDAGLKFGGAERKFDANFSVRYARGTGEIGVNSSFSGAGPYPDLKTDLKGGELDVGYKLSSKLDLRFRVRYEDYSSSDWALQGVDPATIPTVLTLGADPDDYSVVLTTLSFRYSFGGPAAKAEEETKTEP